MADTVHTSIYLPRSLHLALKLSLVREGKSLSEWVREQAEIYLSDEIPTSGGQSS